MGARSSAVCMQRCALRGRCVSCSGLLASGTCGQVKPGETEEDAARRETFEEVGVLCDELYRIGTVPGVGGGVALFAAVRWYGVPWARECGTRVSWERLDALEDVQPSLSSLSASAPLLVAWAGKKTCAAPFGVSDPPIRSGDQCRSLGPLALGHHSPLLSPDCLYNG